MINKELITEMADSRVEYAMSALKNEGNDMGLCCTFLGFGQLKLEIKPETGHNYYLIVDAIYRYYEKNPLSKIDKYYDETLLKIAKHAVSLNSLSILINIVSYQLENQKDKISPFEIDVVPILKELKNSVMNNQKLMDDSNYMQKFSEYDEYLNENYGHKIL